MIYVLNQFCDNLMLIFVFYVYYIIGMDYDFFLLKGGILYFIEVQQIVLNVQVVGMKGWKLNEVGKCNCYWLVDNILQ